MQGCLHISNTFSHEIKFCGNTYSSLNIYNNLEEMMRSSLLGDLGLGKNLAAEIEVMWQKTLVN